MVASSTVTQKL